jgi:hypothetical protein
MDWNRNYATCLYHYILCGAGHQSTIHILIKDLINRTMNYVNYIFNLVTISDILVNLTCLMQLLVCFQQNILSQGCMTYEITKEQKKIQDESTNF